MFYPSCTLLIPLLSSILPALAQVTGRTCNLTSPCPVDAPCCSEFGFCGSGSGFCLGGCNPLSSNTPTSCEPSPVCKSSTQTFPDNSRILSNATYYHGNPSQYDWIVDKGNILNTNSNGGELVMTLTQSNGGTRLSSTRYVHYGTITARLKTGQWRGIVTAFITMSDAKDEIDWEFPGNQTTQGQTNYYWLGVADYNNGNTTDGLSDTFSNYHDYTIDWQLDQLTFLVDGHHVRTVTKSNAGGKYPTTPSRIQFSLWPAGINTSAPGTLQWAGGIINYNDPDYLAAGHFYAMIQSITINCSDPAGSMPPGALSYVYGFNTTTSEGLSIPAVTVTNQTTILNGASARLTGMTLWSLSFASLLAGASTLLF